MTEARAVHREIKEIPAGFILFSLGAGTERRGQKKLHRGGDVESYSASQLYNLWGSHCTSKSQFFHG